MTGLPEVFGDLIPWSEQLRVVGFRQSGGNTTIPGPLVPINSLNPNAFLFFLDYESERPHACELEIQMQYTDPTLLAPGFPVAAFTQGFAAGANAGGANVWDGADPIVLKYETGGGFDARIFYSDTRPGRFSLGVQRRVRVSVARWLVPDTVPILLQGSVTPCDHTDADPLTFSASIVIPAGQSRVITAPPGAAWWDFEARDDFTPAAGANVRANTPFATYLKNTVAAPPIQSPPGTPWPWLSPNSQVTFVNQGAAAARVTVVWWIR